MSMAPPCACLNPQLGAYLIDGKCPMHGIDVDPNRTHIEALAESLFTQTEDQKLNHSIDLLALDLMADAAHGAMDLAIQNGLPLAVRIAERMMKLVPRPEADQVREANAYLRMRAEDVQ